MLTVADFEKGTSGFGGAIIQDATLAKEGKASGKIHGDFTNVAQSRWVTAKLPLDLKNQIKSVRFWVKTTDAAMLTVRIDDSTKQTHQLRPPITPNGEWQQVTIDSFEFGPGHQSYGGAGDKLVHWPARGLFFVLEKNGLIGGKTAGTVWIDQVEVEVVGAPKSSVATLEEIAQESDVIMLADFEGGLSGFSGKIETDVTQPKSGRVCAKMEADLANVTQSAWITAKQDLRFKNEIKALRFWVRSTTARQMTVRLVDATGQTFQQRPSVAKDGAWHAIEIRNFEAGPGFQSFGGAGDKKVHWPARSLTFIVEKNGLEGGKGVLWIDDVEVFLSKERVVGGLDLLQDKLGNVFIVGEKVTLPVDTLADKVTWSVRDFWGKELGKGEAPVRNKRAVIEPPAGLSGYFDVRLEAGASKAETCFAVLPSFDVAAVKDSPFGVMTHFAQSWPVDLMPLIAHAGIKHIRDELYWGSLEKKKGVFVFEDKFERYMTEAKARQVDPLIALTFGNRNYDDTPKAPSYGNAPHTDEGRAAYARYGVEVLKHYGNQLQAVEIWNEYNGTFGRGPVTKDKAKYYFEMLKVAHAAIKKERPDITVVGISAVATPFPYFEDLFKRGALRYMDALSLHPYRTQSTPEGLERLMTKLQDLIKKYNDGKPMPIWITELGWYVKPPGGNSDLVVTEADQASYLVRAITLTLSAGVERFYWYHARDDASFPTSGLLRSTEDPKGRYAPKPSYVAYGTLIRQLDGARFQRREQTVNDEVYSLLFNNGARDVRVVWALAPTTLTVKAAAPLTVVDLMGGTKVLPAEAGEIKLSISDTPVYLVGNVSALPPLEKTTGTLVADAEEEFSSEQGLDGWSYGFYKAPSADAAYDPAAWQPLPRYNVTIWGYEWIGDLKYLTLTPRNGHPAVEGGKPVWAVRRWTSDVAGTIRIKGKLGRADKGDGIGAAVYVDGKPIWKRQIGGGQPGRVSYDVTAAVSRGSVVDLAITPGPGTDTSYDATSSVTTIVLMP